VRSPPDRANSNLVQRLDGVSFREAVRRLAVRSGVHLADN
jgi:DNA primase